MGRFKERLRRSYREVVRGRTSVRVVAATDSADDRPIPIFLIGPFRSGTTLLRYCLDSHPDLAIPPESDFLLSLRPLRDDPHCVRGLESMGFDDEHVLARIRSFSEYFFINYARSHDKPRWADKSPRYVTDLPWVHTVFPDARFVHIVRNPLDQIHSFTSGGTKLMREDVVGVGPSEDLRVASARWWRDVTEAQIAFTQKYPDQNLMITYQDLAQSPEPTLRRILAFLDLPWNPSVLNFNETEHDAGMEDHRIKSTTTFSFATGAYESWPAPVRAECEQITGAAYDLATKLAQ